MAWKPVTHPTNKRCPGCSGLIPPAENILCSKCWWEVPAPDRQALGRMFRAARPMASKLNAVVRALHERRKQQKILNGMIPLKEGVAA